MPLVFWAEAFQGGLLASRSHPRATKIALGSTNLGPLGSTRRTDDDLAFTFVTQ